MIDLVPISQFSERYSGGWRMVKGYDLKAGDYAVVMASPDHSEQPLKNTKAKHKPVPEEAWRRGLETQAKRRAKIAEAA